MEKSSDSYEAYLRLILFIGALIACIAQITSSLTLIDELSCQASMSGETPLDETAAKQSGCVHCNNSACGAMP